MASEHVALAEHIRGPWVVPTSVALVLAAVSFRLGCKPEVPFEEGMKRTESWLRQEKAIG